MASKCVQHPTAESFYGVGKEKINKKIKKQTEAKMETSFQIILQLYCYNRETRSRDDTH